MLYLNFNWFKFNGYCHYIYTHTNVNEFTLKKCTEKTGYYCKINDS